jgi:hypothetical protein
MGSPWRKFSADFERLAARISRDLITEEPFVLEPGLKPEGGATTAVRVTMQASKQYAWAKPARLQANNAADIVCPAHEKIAADLAHLVGLPVPPVALSRKTEGTGLAKVVALSYEALPQGKPWKHLGPALTPEVIAKLMPTLSAMWAFHAWVCDTDHNWNVGNVIVEILPDGTVNVAFIDYSNALTHAWKPPAEPQPQDWSRRNNPYNPCDKAAMAEAIGRIERLPSQEIGSIITRTPEDCLPAATAKHLFEGLDARRGQLKAILKLEGAP